MEQDWGFRNKSLYLFLHLWSIDFQQRCQCSALGKGQLLQQWCWDNWIVTGQKISLDPYLTIYIKFNSNLIIGLIVRAKIIKHLKDNIGEHLQELGLSKDFIAMMPQIWSTKEQIDTLGFIRLKSLRASQDIIEHMKKTSNRLGKCICKHNCSHRVYLL